MLPKGEYKNRFEKLYNLFTEAYSTFNTWQGLQDKSYEEPFNENPNFWNAVLFSLQNTWLTSLAKIYEESSFSKKEKVISVYALILSQKDIKRRNEATQLLRKHSKVIVAVKRLRDNQLAHNNAKHLLNPTKIQKRFPMTHAEIEELLEASSKLLSLLDPKADQGYSYESFAEGCRQDSRSVVEKIRYFSNLQKEHMRKFVNREVDSPQFPPVASV